MSMTVAAYIHGSIKARQNCIERGNTVWRDRWELTLQRIQRELLPSGSGLDSGTHIEGLTADMRGIVLSTEFHHMADSGMYDGWTQHRIYARPSFSGLEISISGRDRNGIKEYLGEVFYNALTSPVPDTFRVGE